MKRLLIPLLAVLAFPTAVNAETMTITKTEYFDTLNYGSFMGSLTAICHAEKEGFISNNEKLEMINIFTRIHKKLHKDKTTYNANKEEVLSHIRDGSDCID